MLLQLLQVMRPIFAAKGIDGDEDGELPEALDQLDLNRCSNDLNYRVKEQMSEHFEAHRLKPGDKGYEYDRRVDFVSNESNEWDESS